MYQDKPGPPQDIRKDKQAKLQYTTGDQALDEALELLMDPVTGSKAHGKYVVGILLIHVDDSFFTGTPEFMTYLASRIGDEYKIGSEDWNDIMFCGQRVKWIFNDQGTKQYISVDQERCIEALEEIVFDNTLGDDLLCDKDLHHQYRSVIGAINWLQSRTQFQACYQFSRCASALAAPKIADVKAANKLVRRIRCDEVTLRYHPLIGIRLRILGYPDASYRNNPDKSS